MTWAKFDDASATHPKAKVAGNEAWALWVAAVIYCNKYLTDGFVPMAALATDCLPEPIPMSKAKKLAEKLCEARVRPGDAGLFERAEGGYLIHDYLSWNDSKADVENKRKRDRDRKRGGKNSTTESTKTPDVIPSGIQQGNRTDSETHRYGMGRLVRISEGGAGGNAIPSLDPAEPIRLPETWDPGFGVLMGTSVPEWAHALLLERYRSYHCPGQEKRTLGNWRQAYSRWACTEWQNPQRRPVRPAVDDPDERRRQAAEKRRQAELQAERDVEDANRRLGIGPNATPPSSTHATRQAVKALVRSAAE